MARGVAVYRSPGPENGCARTAMARTLARCVRLRAWAEERGVVLDDSPESLAELDRRRGDGSEFDRLRADLALYLGTVIVAHVASAHWHARPNGHPVVRLRDGTELDVVALVADTRTDAGSTLMAIYQDAVPR